jgi:hypothetical protein
MISGLSCFYDRHPYGHNRRTNDVKIVISNPQLNILAGATPKALISFMPEDAWGQGFTSRLILVFSDERIIVDDFGETIPVPIADMLHDLKIIAGLHGQFHVTEDYRAAVKIWKDTGELPIPNHPRLFHYITRRKVHIYKLSMISSINRDNGLALTEADFFQAIEWLVEAETHMPDIFKAGATSADAGAMEEIRHFVMVNDLGTGIHEQKISRFAADRLPITSILRIIDIMEASGMLFCVRKDLRTKARFFSVNPPKPLTVVKTTGAPSV